MGEAFNSIRNGDADVIFGGGTEAAIAQLTLASFENAKQSILNLLLQIGLLMHKGMDL